MTQSSTARSRIALALAAAITLATLTAPVAAAPLLDSGPQQDVVTYAPGQTSYPSVIVTVENGSLDSLNAWANESTSRSVISSDADTDRAVVAAPAYMTRDVSVLDKLRGGIDGLTATPLAAESWVESVDVNYQVDLDPPDPLLASEFSPPTIGLTALNDPAFATDGLAFSDEVNESTMADARAAVGGDNVSADGSGVTVAVIDTGANTADGQLFGNGTAGSALRISNASMNTITGASVNTATSNYSAISDGNGHGSWTAAAIAANSSNGTYDAVASDATLMVIKALDDSGSGSTADITEAVRHAADNGADVISMSLGSPIYSEAQADAIQYAYENGVQAIVVAVGNSRYVRGTAIASPADANGNVIAVGATTGEEPAQARSAYFSQVGPDPGTTDNSGGASVGLGVDVAAPGFKLTTQTADEAGALSQSTLSGTSMATPIVASSVAAAMDGSARVASADYRELDSMVTDTARAVPNAALVEVGDGMVAVDNMLSGTDPATTQADAMDDAAQQRDTFYRGLSDASGGVLARLPAVGEVWG